MTMKIGQIETSDNAFAGRRDAFHVPAVLVRSTDKLKPGNNVCFVDNSFTTVVKCTKGKTRHGVVDPFVDKIKPGDLFWVLLMPDTVNNLVHHFNLEIPDVPPAYVPPADPEEEESEYQRGCRGCW